MESVIEFSEANNFEVSYDFEGQISRSINKKSTKKEVIKSEQREIPPKVFISYSWDSAEHKLWVLKLVSELMRNGIDVLIDEWDLEKYKNDLQFFMEAGIRGANKVIMVCTQITHNEQTKESEEWGLKILSSQANFMMK